MENSDPEKQAPLPLVHHNSNGSNPKIGGRICPVLPHLKGTLKGELNTEDPEWASSDDILGKQIESEKGNALQYRTCSWQKVSI